MRAFSAADSVSLAIQRTREFLFRPFQWGPYLKLGLVAILTEGGSNFHSSSGGNHSSGHGNPINPAFHLTPELMAVGVAALLLAFVLFAWLFYLITRLRFAFFHCLIYNSREIRPGWHIYREPATRFFWLNLQVGICYLLVLGLIALPFVSGFVRLYQRTQAGGHLDVGSLLSLVLPLIPIILLLMIAGVLADLILRDWILPQFALENVTAGEAWARVWASIRNETREFVVYVLLRLVLPTIALVAVFMVLLVPGLAVAGAGAAFGYALHSAFAHSTGASAMVGIFLQAFFAMVGFCFMLLAAVCIGGPVSTGIREYALVFFGGRYPVLGDILYPAPPPLPEPGPARFA